MGIKDYVTRSDNNGEEDNIVNIEEEEAIPIENIDPQTCEKIGGTPTEEGFCLMRKVEEKEDGTVSYKPIKWSSRKNRRPKAPGSER